MHADRDFDPTPGRPGEAAKQDVAQDLALDALVDSWLAATRS